MTRLAALVLPVAALLVSAPTRAHADTLSTMPVVERADTLLWKALPTVIQSGHIEDITLPFYAKAHHSVTLAEFGMRVSSRLTVRGGAGMAEIVDAPVYIDMQHQGPAVGAGVSYELAEAKGFKVGLDFSALHVSYGSVGMTDETMLVELQAK
jgi:hypothetical protein